MPKFKIDENLPRGVVGLLTAAGHDAVSVQDQQLSGRPDSEVAKACRREERSLVTLDLDFADIRAYPPSDYGGIIVLRLPRLNFDRVLSAVRRLLPALESEELAGKLWIVNETAVRIRG